MCGVGGTGCCGEHKLRLVVGIILIGGGIIIPIFGFSVEVVYQVDLTSQRFLACYVFLAVGATIVLHSLSVRHRLLFLGPCIMAYGFALLVPAALLGYRHDTFLGWYGLMLGLAGISMGVVTAISCGAYAFLKRRRALFGICKRCGYDLRGLSEYRCPECGTPFDRELLEKGVLSGKQARNG